LIKAESRCSFKRANLCFSYIEFLAEAIDFDLMNLDFLFADLIPFDKLVLLCFVENDGSIKLFV
jgi:hypothetical protein